jgi:HEAT repeat protein
VPALIGLLEDADAWVRSGAAQTLGEWGKVPDLVRSIVSPLIPDHPDPVVELLTHARDDFMPMCVESSTVKLVIRALTPDQGDTPLVTQLRGIVYQWLWQVAGVAG